MGDFAMPLTRKVTVRFIDGELLVIEVPAAIPVLAPFNDQLSICDMEGRCYGLNWRQVKLIEYGPVPQRA
jgi:hypothetical protein